MSEKEVEALYQKHGRGLKSKMLFGALGISPETLRDQAKGLLRDAPPDAPSPTKKGHTAVPTSRFPRLKK